MCVSGVASDQPKQTGGRRSEYRHRALQQSSPAEVLENMIMSDLDGSHKYSNKNFDIQITRAQTFNVAPEPGHPSLATRLGEGDQVVSIAALKRVDTVETCCAGAMESAAGLAEATDTARPVQADQVEACDTEAVVSMPSCEGLGAQPMPSSDGLGAQQDPLDQAGQDPLISHGLSRELVVAATAASGNSSFELAVTVASGSATVSSSSSPMLLHAGIGANCDEAKLCGSLQKHAYYHRKKACRQLSQKSRKMQSSLSFRLCK